MNNIHLSWIIPLSFMLGFISFVTMFNIVDNNFENYILNYCSDSKYIRYIPLEVNLNLSVTKLQDNKMYWCQEVGSYKKTYAFINNLTNASYGMNLYLKS